MTILDGKMSTETLLINLATSHGRWPEHLPSGTWSVRPISSRSLPTRPSSPGVPCLAAFSTCVSSSLVWVPLLSSQVLIHYHCHSNYKDIIIHWFPSTDTHFFQPKISFASTYCRSTYFCSVKILLFLNEIRFCWHLISSYCNLLVFISTWVKNSSWI